MPVPISSLIGGSSGGGFPEQRAFTTSGSFVAPRTGKYLLTAIGGGAAGTNGGRGGGAGGFAQKLVSLSAGDVIIYTVGAGGVLNGAAGGNTTITAPGVSFAANGGTATAGGTASGGDVNVQGGSSGNVVASGGGAVGVYGVGYESAASEGSGGAGVGSASTGSTPGNALALGGGYSFDFFGRILCPAGSGGNMKPGSGGIGSGVGEAGGMFSGGGGGGAQYSPQYAGAGGMFGGGGGGSALGLGGAGGKGGVIIEWVTS